MLLAAERLKPEIGDVVLINISVAPGSDSLVKGVIDSLWLNGEMASLVIPGFQNTVPFNVIHLAKV